ncbi:Fic family protein [Companilactobacillus furfuricola]|uniref:Fic family protein n=1 Tax=Companilactobacillus furfuricola TaxID=1462575 RepID=UPI0013DDA530|nr:Fic family protein [Companilactobacillus furfuricola]
MARKPLSILMYMSSKESNIDVEEIYQEYLQSETSIVTNLYPFLTDRMGNQHSDRPIFYSNTVQISLLTSKIFENSRKIRTINNYLPKIAKDSFISSLLTDEIKYSNDIEEVTTYRRDLGTIVAALNEGTKVKQQRLLSTVQKYLGAIKYPQIKISKLSEIRNIYDQLTEGEIENTKLPDGKLFRNGAVMIGTIDGSKVVHRPPINETLIEKKLLDLIMFMNNDDIPTLEKAVITHFMFENIHPFYDGNGRMGRYLLTQYLSKKNDPYTALSISGSIISHEAKYYRSFDNADKYENYSELTFFVQDILNIVADGQTFVINKLSELKSILEENMTKIKDKFSDHQNAEIIIEILSLFVQSKLFNVDRSLGIKDTQMINTLYDYNKKVFKKKSVKQIIRQLETDGILKLVNGNPIQHEIVLENI